jgi:gamma-glutamyltranspeptidase/glutathione hydrolase
MPFLEPETPDVVVKGLETRGHQVTVVDGPQRGWGPVSVIGLDGDERWAAADPRVDTAKALVF